MNTTTVNPAPARQLRRVDGTGTRRKLQALAANGWPWADVAEHAGSTTQAIKAIVQGKSDLVHVDTAKMVGDVYKSLHAVDGPDSRTRACSARKGWASPSRWAGLDIDNPQAVPHPDPDRRAEPEPETEAHGLSTAQLSTVGKGLPCQRVDADIYFFPGSYASPEADVARRLCGECPIRVACLSGALGRGEEHGIFAGLGPDERLATLRRSGQGETAKRVALQQRRAEVVDLVDRGLPTWEAARRLGISLETVKRDLEAVAA